MILLEAITISLTLLIALGVLAVIGIIALIVAIIKYFSEDNDKIVTVDAKWVDLPAPNKEIDSAGVNFKVHVFAKIEGYASTANLTDQEVAFKALKDGTTIKTPANGKPKTGKNGIATCNFTGQTYDSTRIEAKVTIDGKEIVLSAPMGTGEYETRRD